VKQKTGLSPAMSADAKKLQAAEEKKQKLQQSALDVDFETSVPEDKCRNKVPRLDDLCVRYLADHFDKYPALDHIKQEYVAAVVELINTSKISYSAASKYIKNEMFWKKSTLERWPQTPHEISEHGMSWRRLYAELHITERFERFFPSKCGSTLQNLIQEVECAKPFVQTIRFRQLRTKIDLSKVLGDFQNLQTLDLTYGKKKVGMGYEKSLFGMHLTDAMSLSRLIANSRALTRVVLQENLIDDETVHVIGSGLAKNNTVTYLDLSHNCIADRGAERLAKLLQRGSMLIDIDLSDNQIGDLGAGYLADALRLNDVLSTLSLRQNLLSDNGGEEVLDALVENSSLSELDLSANELEAKTGGKLLQILRSNDALTTLNLACNSVITDEEGKLLIGALEKNATLTKLDLRKNADAKVLGPIKKLLKPRAVKEKQVSRKRYQNGWDLVDD